MTERVVTFRVDQDKLFDVLFRDRSHQALGQRLIQALMAETSFREDLGLAVYGIEVADCWRPIETAPRGRIILLWAVTDRDENGKITNWKMATGATPFAGPIEWTWDGYRLRDWDVQPTHWMPLPGPPEVGDKGDNQ